MQNRTIAVYGNAELAAELAVVISENKDIKVCIADIDSLNPTLDLLLDVKKVVDKVTSFKTDTNNTGINIALDAIDKNLMTQELLIKCMQEKAPNFYVMTGNYAVDNYEYHMPESFYSLVKLLQEAFDILILCAMGNIYDEFTKIAIEESHLVLIPVTSSLAHIRTVNSLVVFLDNNGIEGKKFKYVAFEYNEKTGLPLRVLKDLSHNRLIGAIPYTESRENMRSKRVMYPLHMEKLTLKRYVRLARKLGINVEKIKSEKWFAFFKR